MVGELVGMPGGGHNPNISTENSKHHGFSSICESGVQEPREKVPWLVELSMMLLATFLILLDAPPVEGRVSKIRARA